MALEKIAPRHCTFFIHMLYRLDYNN